MPPILANVMGRRPRSSGANPSTDPKSASNWPRWGRRFAKVSDMDALSLTAFYRGIALIAGTVGGLPMHVYEDVEINGASTASVVRSEDTAFIWRRPNIEMTRISMWERVVADEVRGNAFVFVDKSDEAWSGGFGSLWWVDRNRFRVGRTSDRRKIYELDGTTLLFDYKQGGEILHIPNWGDALWGYDPVDLAPNALALGISAEEYAARATSEGQIPPGVLTTDQVLTEDQADELVDEWESKHGGLAKSNRIAVLGRGATFKDISRNLADMQNVESRKFTVAEVARLLGLPNYLLGDVDHASQGGGNGLEEQNRQLTTFNFNGHISRITQAVTDDLLVYELSGRYARMNTGGLLRGNTLARYQAYRLADWLTINEKRALEELPPIAGGDKLLAMTNMAPLDKLEEIALGSGN